ncbi:DUF4238 domain-containing protein [Paraburkholderia largidicola]|uniref:DUF4238 domain-containing protein n=1 Tax=Paraburkholderia largidicola TaxID=3014751 RepID=A0A7I8BL49_9BURK|nr:DUF4238 domain-containing protein [Paraburkholderia sp. PGU16]BCF89098.1 hypothetical protein PPGU16_21650 [Paraburkholderia sp. PGU16]
MQQIKRHHFVPKAYLNAFCDPSGRLLVYRKDAPWNPLRQTPDATQFRRYYYSQPTPDGSRDNNTLEALFSTVESEWPTTVEKLKRRENANDRLNNIFEFMALQRARVPAARDLAEATLAQALKDTMKVMLANGDLPPPPPSLDDVQTQIQVSIDPHKSIQAMVDLIQGMGPLYRMLGISAVHNNTGRPFLTSDNPVIWFDPSLPFNLQRPYTIDRERGPVCLFFPISPKLALVGSTEYKDTFALHGLKHSDVPNEDWVDLMNAQVCRFAYEAVIATSRGQEETISEFAHISPVHEAMPLRVGKGILTIHRQVFGPRTDKPKWRDKE